jgi:hypothetical protein
MFRGAFVAFGVIFVNTKPSLGPFVALSDTSINRTSSPTSPIRGRGGEGMAVDLLGFLSPLLTSSLSQILLATPTPQILVVIARSIDCRKVSNIVLTQIK